MQKPKRDTKEKVPLVMEELIRHKNTNQYVLSNMLASDQDKLMHNSSVEVPRKLRKKRISFSRQRWWTMHFTILIFPCSVF